MRSLLHHWWDMGGIQKNVIWQGGDKESQPGRSSVYEQTGFLLPHCLTNHKNGLWKTWLMWQLKSWSLGRIMMYIMNHLISCAVLCQFPFWSYTLKQFFLIKKNVLNYSKAGKIWICTWNHIFFVFGMSGEMIDLTTVAMETCVSGVDWQLTQFEGGLTSKIEVCLHV